MLSLIIVIFCAFITINGLDTCETDEKEDWVCTTPCGGDCGAFHREATGLRRADASCSGSDVQDCKSVLDTLRIPNYDDCEEIDYWINKVWESARADEKASGTLTVRSTGLTASLSSRIPGFRSQWKRNCRVQVRYRITSPWERPEDRPDGVPAFSAADAKAGAIERLRNDEHACSKYQWRNDDAFPPAIGRNYLFVTSGEPRSHKAVIKYCAARSVRDREGDKGRNAYETQILQGFRAKAGFAMEAAGVGAAGGRTRAGGRHRADVRAVPPPPARVVPPPPPRPHHGASSSDQPAHEEYVDSLWEEVNGIEEDELRYERAWDQLRKAQRSFDMAAKLRKLHKKKLRQYYH